MRLILESKTHDYEHDGATFKVRELNTHERECAYWVGKKPGTNEFNMGIVVTEALVAGVEEWKGLEDALGNPLPIDRKVIEALPTDLRMTLFGLAMGNPVPFVEKSSDAT
jgi:hypothetical protein